MIAYLSLIVAVIGCLCYALSTNPKLAELGRIGFFCGLLVFLFNLGTLSLGFGR